MDCIFIVLTMTWTGMSLIVRGLMVMYYEPTIDYRRMVDEMCEYVLCGIDV